MSDPFPVTARPVPSGRFARLVRLGGLAAGVAGGALGEGARRIARGERPALPDLLLTPGNLAQVAGRLAEMRGAAMKIGQLVSMDAGDLLSPELSATLATLREGARPMPPRQLGQVLDAAWGSHWRKGFESFDVHPVAAASIGQVHRARARDGRDLAIKVQYPGVKQSIDSDVGNVATLLRVSGLVPSGLDLGPLLAEARQQLHEEADYEREAGNIIRARALLADDPSFRVPDAYPDLSTGAVLAMEFVGGEPMDGLEAAPQAERDRVAALLIGLALRELLDWRWMQTDPNLANYRMERGTGRVVLYDFGAARDVEPRIAGLYREALLAARDGTRDLALRTFEAFGALDAATPEAAREEVLALFDTSAAALLREGPFDFGATRLVEDLRERGMALVADRSTWRAPPGGTLFIQRKLGGTYLMAARLRARVDLRALLDRHL
jgi:predicted unusual protein kinase regulating ubiquinone biosynthesis (AarF/ABC1/UbiB family)